jgi:hypothetical protein
MFRGKILSLTHGSGGTPPPSPTISVTLSSPQASTSTVAYGGTVTYTGSFNITTTNPSGATLTTANYTIGGAPSQASVSVTTAPTVGQSAASGMAYTIVVTNNNTTGGDLTFPNIYLKYTFAVAGASTSGAVSPTNVTYQSQ